MYRRCSWYHVRLVRARCGAPCSGRRSRGRGSGTLAATVLYPAAAPCAAAATLAPTATVATLLPLPRLPPAPPPPPAAPPLPATPPPAALPASATACSLDRRLAAVRAASTSDGGAGGGACAGGGAQLAATAASTPTAVVVGRTTALPPHRDGRSGGGSCGRSGNGGAGIGAPAAGMPPLPPPLTSAVPALPLSPTGAGATTLPALRCPPPRACAPCIPRVRVVGAVDLRTTHATNICAPAPLASPRPVRERGSRRQGAAPSPCRGAELAGRCAAAGRWQGATCLKATSRGRRQRRRRRRRVRTGKPPRITSCVRWRR